MLLRSGGWRYLIIYIYIYIDARNNETIWYNPPYTNNVRTNIGREFLKLIDKHFPHENKLHKIFNRNTVKVSYSCMENIRSVISKHNFRILTKEKPRTDKPCNWRMKDACLLKGKCQANNIVYQATITSNDNNKDTRHYIGMLC